MYNDPNGFTKNFDQENNKWCINGGFSKMLEEYEGKDQFTFKTAVVLKDFAQCEPDELKAIIVQFYAAGDPTGAPFVSFGRGGD